MAHLDPEKVLGGSILELSRKSGVHRPQLTDAREGRAGLSLPNARKLAAAVGSDEPLTLWAQSQLNAITKAKHDSINTYDGYGTALRRAAAVLDQLRLLEPTELAKEAATLEGVIQELTKTVAEIVAGGTAATGNLLEDKKKKPAVTKSRDAFGRSYEPPADKVERDPFGRAVGK